MIGRFTGNAVDLYEKLTDLVQDQAEWSQKTFGADPERGPIGPLKHLAKEAGEAQGAWVVLIGTRSLDPDHAGTAERHYLEELADCLLLLLDAIRRGGHKFGHVVDAAREKMVKNKARTWPAPTSDEPVEHVRED